MFPHEIALNLLRCNKPYKIHAFAWIFVFIMFHSQRKRAIHGESDNGIKPDKIRSADYSFSMPCRSPETLVYVSGHSQAASKKPLYLLYCCSLIIHLCGAKKNKIHRNPGR